MKYYLGLDVGGTNLAAGVVDENYRLISRVSVSAGAGRSIREITADMADISRLAVTEAGLKLTQISSWGIGMPSYVNPRTELLVHANCFGWRNVPIYEYLDGTLPLPLKIENDANCAVLGETLVGAARGYQNVLMLTLGTGVGGGVIMDGRIWCGADGLGAEMGHSKLVYGGRRCTCGQLGCLDGYCSARGLVRTAAEKMTDRESTALWGACHHDIRKLTARSITEAAAAGDRLAEEVWSLYVDQLASAIGSFTAIFRPETVILGGGMSGAGDLLLTPLRERVMEDTFASREIGIPEIRLAEAGNDAGIIGAALLETYGMERRKSKQEDGGTRPCV